MGLLVRGGGAVAPGSIGSSALADNAVTLAKVADDAVGPAELVIVGALLQRNAAQAIPTGAATAIDFDNVNFDAGGIVVGDSVVIPTAGRYRYQFVAAFAAGALGTFRRVLLYRNGASFSTFTLPPHGAVSPVPLYTSVFAFAAGDVLTLRAEHDAGVDQNVTYAELLILQLDRTA